MIKVRYSFDFDFSIRDLNYSKIFVFRFKNIGIKKECIFDLWYNHSCKRDLFEKENIMTIAIIYSSCTGNTKKLAETIKDTLKNQNIIYFGKVVENIPEADFYLIGSWTNKGQASDDIVHFVKKLKHKKIAYFGTAGYGGSEDYYRTLYERLKNLIDDSNQIIGYFYCQGKMPMQVRERYVQMITEHPEDTKLNVSIQNFDEALSHPDEIDLENLRKWINSLSLSKS